jgi:hypothetical protein
MSAIRRALGWIGKQVDRIDQRIDKPAKGHGTYLQGSETMVDSDLPEESGRSVRNKRSGFGRQI